MTSLEDSMKMQAMAILISISDTPRPVKKRIFDEFLNMAKIKLNREELEEYEMAMKPPVYAQMSPLVYSQPSISVSVQEPDYGTMSAGEIAFRLASEMVFKYIARRQHGDFEEIIKQAKIIALTQELTNRSQEAHTL